MNEEKKRGINMSDIAVGSGLGDRSGAEKAEGKGRKAGLRASLANDSSSLAAVVLQALDSHGPMTVLSLCTELKQPEGQIEVALNYLESCGQAKRHDSGLLARLLGKNESRWIATS